MLNEGEKSSLLEKSRLLKEECNGIKQELDKVKEQREKHFKKKEELKEEIKKLIFQIKNVKGQNDNFSKTISDLKSQRDSYNKKVKELIVKIKELNSKKISLAKGKSVNIDYIKKQINQLEQSIETNAYTYDKEQKVNDKIKKLKKVYNENHGIVKLDDELRLLSIEIDSSKKIADDFHKKFDETIKQSRSQGSDFMDLSRKISLLKQEQEKEFEKFKKQKSIYVDIINKLKAKSEEIKLIGSQISLDHTEKAAVEKNLQKKNLDEKLRSVKEKIIKEKRLTREDLIVLQAEDAN